MKLNQAHFPSAILSFLILCTGACLIASMAVLPNELYWILPGALMLGIAASVAALKPEIFFPLLTFVVFFQYALYDTVYQKYLVVWDELAIVLLAISIILRRLSNSTLTLRKTPFDWLIISFVFVCIISAVVNAAPIMPAMDGMRIYLFYILLFYCVVNLQITRKTIKNVIAAMILAFLLQIPILAVQAIMDLRAGLQLGIDSLYGTFPGANNLSYATLFPLFLFLGLKAFRLKSLQDFFILLGLIGVLVAGQGRLAIVLFVIILMSLWGKTLLTGRVPVKVIGIACVFVILLGSYFVFTKETFLKNYNLWKQFTKSEFTVRSGSARYIYYPLTYNWLKEDGTKRMMFGFGPGMYGSFAGFKHMTPMTKQLATVFHQKKYGVDPYVSSQIIPIWGELGFVGIVIYYLLLFKIYLFAAAARKGTDDPLIRALSVGLIAGSFLMIIGSFFNPVFEVQTSSYPFWLLAGLLVTARMTNAGEGVQG